MSAVEQSPDNLNEAEESLESHHPVSSGDIHSIHFLLYLWI